MPAGKIMYLMRGLESRPHGICQAGSIIPIAEKANQAHIPIEWHLSECSYVDSLLEIVVVCNNTPEWRMIQNVFPSDEWFDSMSEFISSTGLIDSRRGNLQKSFGFSPSYNVRLLAGNLHGPVLQQDISREIR